MLTLGSLFSGIGGLELGLELALRAAGIVCRVAWQVERDDFCRRVLAKHWPNADRSVTDVRAATSLPRVDLICGGFPCQDVSGAGKGAGLAGARSGLWFEFLRIVEQLRPRFVVVENVESGARRWLCAVRRGLREAGYRTRALGVAASDVGAPHRRRRIFVVAYADGEHGDDGGCRAGSVCGQRPAAAELPGGECMAYSDCLGGVEREGSEPRGRGWFADGGPQVGRAMAHADRRPVGLEPWRGHGSRGTDPPGPLGGGEGVGDTGEPRREWGDGRGRAGTEGARDIAPESGPPVDDTYGAGRGQAEAGSGSGGGAPAGGAGQADDGRAAEPGVGRDAHGVPGGLDRGDARAPRWPAGRGEDQHAWEPPRTVSQKIPDRRARVKACGNAVVPACAAAGPGRVLVELLRQDADPTQPAPGSGR